VHELVQAKVEQRAPEVAIAPESGEAPKVINIMDALKKSMQAKGGGRHRARRRFDQVRGTRNETCEFLPQRPLGQRLLKM
jgi:non-homologous end joining protein Ku